MKSVLIAGVSGGIGKAIADQLLAESPQVQVWGLCRTPAAVVFDANVRPRLSLIQWDARTTDQHLLTESLKAHLPGDLPLDTVFYAAGILHGDGLFPEKRLDEVRADALTSAFQVNAVGFAMLIQALQPWLRHGDFKRLVAISAKVGSITDNRMGGWYAYRTSKAALNMLVRNLAIELPRRHRPVTCVAVHPGTTETRLSEPFQRSLARLEVHEPSDTANNLITIARQLREADNGRFINWDGKDLPW